MTLAEFIAEKGLGSRLATALGQHPGGQQLLADIATLPIRRSHAVKRLGSYVTRNSKPIEIRLQFALEADLLVETFLHELAHCLDHLTNQGGQHYRRAHGRGWQKWALALGIVPNRCGESEALRKLYEQRLKVVAVCKRCGFRLRRVRKLASNRRYIHPQCGGRLQPC